MVRGERADELKSQACLMVIILGVAAIAAVGITILVMRAESQPEASLFRPNDSQLVRLDEGLYRDHCAACHGADLEGATPDWQIRDEDVYLPGPPHDEIGHTWHHPDQLLFDITKYGIGEAANLPDYPTRMLAFEGVLKDEEIIAILSFIKSHWPERIRQYQDDKNRRLEERSARGE
jgi:S-disulfanyl-L-cysteine oxidoreductase SoxD